MCRVTTFTLHERHAKLIISCMPIVSGKVFAYSMLNIRKRKTGRVFAVGGFR